MLTHRNSSYGYGKVKFKLGYWAVTRIKESTDGEWMKVVKCDASFQRHRPRQMDPGLGVTA